LLLAQGNRSIILSNIEIDFAPMFEISGFDRTLGNKMGGRISHSSINITHYLPSMSDCGFVSAKAIVYSPTTISEGLKLNRFHFSATCE